MSMECIQTVVTRGPIANGMTYIMSMECIQTVVTRGPIANVKLTLCQWNVFKLLSREVQQPTGNLHYVNGMYSNCFVKIWHLKLLN